MKSLKSLYFIFGHVTAGLFWSLFFAVISFGFFLGLGYGKSKSEAPAWFVWGSMALWIIAFVVGAGFDNRSTRKVVERDEAASNRMGDWRKSVRK